MLILCNWDEKLKLTEKMKKKMKTIGDQLCSVIFSICTVIDTRWDLKNWIQTFCRFVQNVSFSMTTFIFW